MKRRRTPPVWGTAVVFVVNAGLALGALDAVVTRAHNLVATLVGLASIPLVGALGWSGLAGLRGGHARAVLAGAAAGSTLGIWTLSVACLAPLVLVLAARGVDLAPAPRLGLVLAIVAGGLLCVRATWRQSRRIAAALRADGDAAEGALHL